MKLFKSYSPQEGLRHIGRHQTPRFLRSDWCFPIFLFRAAISDSNLVIEGAKGTTSFGKRAGTTWASSAFSCRVCLVMAHPCQWWPTWWRICIEKVARVTWKRAVWLVESEGILHVPCGTLIFIYFPAKCNTMHVDIVCSFEHGGFSAIFDVTKG